MLHVHSGSNTMLQFPYIVFQGGFIISSVLWESWNKSVFCGSQTVQPRLSNPDEVGRGKTAAKTYFHLSA